MRRLVALAAVAAAFLAGCAGSEPISSADGDAVAGEAVYAASCATCHGSDLGGTASGPSLLDAGYLAPGFSDDDLYRSIDEGYLDPSGGYGPMPGFPNLGRRAIADLMAFVRAAQDAAG